MNPRHHLSIALIFVMLPTAVCADNTLLMIGLCKKIQDDSARLKCFDSLDTTTTDSAARHERNAEPITFRGIRLGVPLSEFRAMAFPDATAKPNARPLCTGDKALPNDASINLSKDLKRINVVACRYYAPSKITNINGSAFLYEAAPDFANVGGYETTFYFTPITAPEQIRQRLYLITIKPSSDHHQTIFEALTTKYGPPDSSQQSQIHNRMGAQFTDATAIWTSGETTLFFKRYNEDVRQAIVMFYHTIGSDYVNAAIRALANENAKKL